MAAYRDESERRDEVARWRASGQSAAAYCASHGMSEQSLRRWRNEVEGRPSSRAPGFVRIEVARRPPSRVLTLEVGRARVRVEAGFDAELLRDVVEALSGGVPT
jgi:hypothetical protein